MVVRRAGRSASSEQGAAAVEMALVLPLLMAILLGLIELGFAFNAQISLTQAVREGVRFGAIGEAPTVADMESEMQRAYLGLYGADVPGAVASDSQACGPNPDPADQARLVGQLEFTSPIVRFQPTLRAEAVMRCGG